MNKKVVKTLIIYLILALFINISNIYAAIDISAIDQGKLEPKKDYMDYIFASSAIEKVLNVCKFLGVISIILMVKAFKSQKETNVLKIYIAIYAVYIFSIVIFYMYFNQSLSLNHKHISNEYGITFFIVALIVKIITIIYPMYIIIKNKKESLKGDN